MMAIMCYLPFVSVVSSIAALATEPISNKFVRFHAWQALFFICAMFASLVVVFVVAMINPIMAAMVNLMFTGGYMYKSVRMMLSANKGEMTKLPVIGDWADGML